MIEKTIKITDKKHCDYCNTNYVVSYNDQVSICLYCGTQTVKNFPEPNHYLVLDFQQKLPDGYEKKTDLDYQIGIDKYQHALKAKVLTSANNFYNEEKNKLLSQNSMMILDDVLTRKVNDNIMSLGIDCDEVRSILLSPLEDNHIKTTEIKDAGSTEFRNVVNDIARLAEEIKFESCYDAYLIAYLRLLQSLILEGKYDEAIDAFNTMYANIDCDIDTDESNYLYGLACSLIGRLFVELKDDDKALHYYHKADQALCGYYDYGDHQFDYIKCLYQKGRVLERLLEFDCAEEMYMKACCLLFNMESDTRNNDETVMLSMLYERQAIVNTLQGLDEVAMDCHVKAIGYLHDGVSLRPDERIERTYVDTLLNYASFLEDVYEEYNAVLYYEIAARHLQRLDDDFHRYNLAAVAHYLSVYHNAHDDSTKAMNYSLMASEALLHLCEDDEDYLELMNVCHNDSK
ncbi:MAG: hypothetical protein J6P61_03565 [Erysipelotrichaceae bacterium]|nr:hypothetical protein [Erysipelotrichaceae bacterium]